MNDEAKESAPSVAAQGQTMEMPTASDIAGLWRDGYRNLAIAFVGRDVALFENVARRLYVFDREHARSESKLFAQEYRAAQVVQ